MTLPPTPLTRNQSQELAFAAQSPESTCHHHLRRRK